MRNPISCIGKNKRTDQLCSHCRAAKHICFPYMYNTRPFLLSSKISSFSLLLMHYSLICVGPGQNLEKQFSCVVAHSIDWCERQGGRQF